MKDDRRLIYQQDCESFRYQKNLFWSRFQTLIIIEGAAIGIILTDTIRGMSAVILSAGTLVVIGLILMVAFKNLRDGENFIERIHEYENKNHAMDIHPKENFKILFWTFAFNSTIFTKAVFILLEVLNIYLILFAFFRMVNSD